MISKYSVVHYLPNPLSGEKINIGVIAWTEGRVAARFIQDWRRVRSFGREDIGFLQEFIKKMEGATTNNPKLPTLDENIINPAQLESMIGSWAHSIEFSEPRSSLKPIDEVLREVAPIYLREAPQRAPRLRDHRHAAGLIFQNVFDVLRERRVQGAENLIKKHHSISGKFDNHPFDVVVAKVHPFLAAQGLSFESSPQTLEKEVDSTAWAIDDVRKIHRKLPVAVFLLPPKHRSTTFERAQRIFTGLNASVFLSEQQVSRWAMQNTKELAA